MSGYEFSAAENEEIGLLAKRMRFVGLTAIVLAVIAGIAALFGETDGLLNAVLFAVGGVWVVRAADGFGRIVTTEGADISHLVEALRQLRKLFTLLFFLIAIGLVVMTIVMLTAAGVLAVRAFQ